VVVVFALVADRSDHDLSFANDSKQCYISRSPEWNDQLALKPVGVGNTASERIRFQNSKFCADGRYCTTRQIQISVQQSGLDQEVFKTQ